MSFGVFHHPDISLPVIRRRVGEELLDWVGDFAEFVAVQGRSLTWNRSLPKRTAYRSAMHRMRKAGFVACITREGQPVLRLTAEGRERLGVLQDPDRFWKRKWNGVWYALLYDVPETQRSYREALRAFLKRLRLGQLQRSVWITPWDIRPEFDDLARASGVRDYAHLIEFRTTLGAGNESLVEQAWDFQSLDARQDWFCRTCEKRLREIGKTSPPAEALTALYRQESAAFRAVMAGDPLLPRKLWPEFYKGEEAHRIHRRFVKAIASRL
ncbi:MAG: hypothetical protein V1929_07540 [bacterium]